MNKREEYTDTFPGQEHISYPEKESVMDLVKDFRDEVFLLVRQEVALAKSEMNEKVSRAVSNITALAIGAIVAIAGFVVVLGGLGTLLSWAFLATGVSVTTAIWIGLFIVGGVTGIVGVLLLMKGISTLKKTSIIPDKTLNSLKEDQLWLRKQK